MLGLLFRGRQGRHWLGVDVVVAVVAVVVVLILAKLSSQSQAGRLLPPLALGLSGLDLQNARLELRSLRCGRWDWCGDVHVDCDRRVQVLLRCWCWDWRAVPLSCPRWKMRILNNGLLMMGVMGVILL